MNIENSNSAAISDYKLDDRYDLSAGQVYLTGSQALVRLAMLQQERDAAAGLNVAGFISGYTGSPLAGFDTALTQAVPLLKAHNIHFQPGLNEDLAATSVWGSQQTQLIAGAKFDGVFGIWYGKGPGLDRSGDALKHGSYSGTAKNGGVLVLAGDDHGAKSSTTAHQSDQAFIHFGMPYLNPSNVQEYLDFGLHGFAMSRFSGCWIGMKCITDTVESSASVSIHPDRVRVTLPDGEMTDAAGRHLRWGVTAVEAEVRQYQSRLPAVQAYIRANRLDREVIVSPRRRLGIVTSGKSFLDVMQALDELELDVISCGELGISVYKIAMPWPLEQVGAMEFAAGFEELLVVEEKRPVIEDQLARLLVNLADRPTLVGKFDETGKALINSEGELDPGMIASVIARRLTALTADAACEVKLLARQARLAPRNEATATLRRLPSFCAGCPHNSSTLVPQGSIAFGGIGCHGMATFMPDRQTPTLFQMGGEGAPWIGIAPFTDTKHIFQNIGDGTYFHSGILAIRAAVAAGVNITYKILVNDAIAMTGGQEIEGQVGVDRLVQQVAAEGVRRIAVVSDRPEQFNRPGALDKGVAVYHRDALESVQTQMRDVEGVTVIVYEQRCATELRRRRKRGTAEDPDQRTFINERVCEGCGDCSVQSNCIAVEPVETEFGRKRQINQTACNKDFSCLKGYCPSFVSVYGATPRKRGGVREAGFDILERVAVLPRPAVVSHQAPYDILITGIGGSGVVTLGALLGMAAHLEGKGCSVLDMSGLAQRNGPVTSHIRVLPTPGVLCANRITIADLVIGSDIVVTAGQDILDKMVPGRTHAVVNSHVAPTADFARNPDLNLSSAQMAASITATVGDEMAEFVEATELAKTLLGNEVAANLFLIGYALQRGSMPVSLASIERAIELNAVSVDMNKQGLAWGRLAAHDLDAVRKVAGQQSMPMVAATPETLESLLGLYKTELVAYQNAAYAERYEALVRKVEQEERHVAPQKKNALSMAVARYYFKLLAYKDEYEVARLYSAPAFIAKLREAFEGDFKIELNLAPPILQKRDSRTGRYRKRKFGPWILVVMRYLQKGKCLRGSRLDLFGYFGHRQEERKLIVEYEAMVATLLEKLSVENYELAVEIASLPEQVRGYDSVKEQNILRMRQRQQRLLQKISVPTVSARSDDAERIPSMNQAAK